jgi:Zn finger protein HypA/HybF involved in hydrogenase expression
MAASGDSCPKCRAGRLAVASSQRAGAYQTRYLRCKRCGATDKHVVAAGEIRRRGLFTNSAR